jgi:hypothetical protein
VRDKTQVKDVVTGLHAALVRASPELLEANWARIDIEFVLAIRSQPEAGYAERVDDPY